MFLHETRAVIAATLVTAFSIPATPSQAADDVRTERVSYADLNLDTEAGAHTLALRLRAAAKRVCDIDFLGAGAAEEARCEKTAIDSARKTLEERRLAINARVWDIASR